MIKSMRMRWAEDRVHVGDGKYKQFLLENLDLGIDGRIIIN
jgi:hypothetical protein